MLWMKGQGIAKFTIHPLGTTNNLKKKKKNHRIWPEHRGGNLVLMVLSGGHWPSLKLKMNLLAR